MEESTLDHKAVSRTHSYQPQKKRYRILSTRKSRRKTCPEIFTNGNDSNDNERALYYQQLADKHFFLGNHETAATYYSALLDREFQKSFQIDDLNNNDIFSGETKSRNWAKEYLALKIVEVNEKIMISPTEPEGYLEKAAVLFFEDKWDEAREVLNVGLVKCYRRTVLKTTLSDMNKIGKALEKYSSASN